MVGARFPGVILVAVSRPLRAMLYWQRMYFWAAGGVGYGLALLGFGVDGWEGEGGLGLTDDAAYAGCDHVDEFLV